MEGERANEPRKCANVNHADGAKRHARGRDARAGVM
jgi:hypothetical protein